MSLSVDYWDYLGWKDTLAQPKFSERQKAFAKALGDGMVYTPQVVVNGVVHVNGSDEGKIAAPSRRPTRPLLRRTCRCACRPRATSWLSRSAPHRKALAAKEATIWLAVISPSVEVPITRGENKGKTVTYSNVVRDLMPIGMWNGKAMTVQLERHSIMHAGAERCAVLVQQGRAGPIVGAALMKQF